MVEWSGDDGWKQAKKRSEDFRKYRGVPYYGSMMNEIAGTRQIFIRPGDKQNLSLWVSIAGLNKKLTQIGSDIDFIYEVNDKVDKMEKKVEELEKGISVDDELQQFIAGMNDNQRKIYKGLLEIKKDPESDLTQRKLAEEVGCNETYISQQKSKFSKIGLLQEEVDI